eukprot:CAMPEP_0119093514 /NCGR_PEP_ID=MMETSP1178-20130426/163361_1 /TAXON_ID=33656 /ORGANISM="unid sp, Strain CCMP2000" /LENGTH=211 /DNA_ID=CAMNT_0007077173 /DNA_START=40 /DNA_END=675 /DNA_ORIENTATION=+
MLNSLPASFGGGRPNTPTRESAPLQRARDHFTFNWGRGKDDKKAESGYSYLSQWSSYGEGLPHLRTSHWKYFVVMLVAAGSMFSLAGLFLPLVLIRPQKFSLFFTLGSLLVMSAFAVLRGPTEQLKHMLSIQRLPFTATYIGSMVLTLYAALVAQSYLLVILFSAVQVSALAWYVLSYLPGGAPALKLFAKVASRGVRSCCGGEGKQLLPL